MNPDIQNPALETPSPSPESANSNPQTPTPFNFRGNGKIARLPKSVRDQINQWMLDGVSYPDIIQRLGEHGKDLKPDNLSQWKKRGHQDWLLEQAWLAQTRARQEPAVDLSADFDATQLNHAALQLGTLHIFEALRDLTPSSSSSSSSSSSLPAEHQDSDSRLNPNDDPSGPPPQTGAGQGEGEQIAPAQPVSPIPNQKSKIKNVRPRSQLDLRLGGDSSAFVRLINALARASRETMLVQKYREACARAHAALTELKDPNRKLNERETRAIVRKVDEILGFASPEDEEPSSTPPPNEQPPLASAA